MHTTTLSRRQVATGAAWSVPVLILGTAAPAAAASPVYCSQRSSTATTSMATATTGPGYTRTNSTNGTWRTDDPDGSAALYSPATIAISSTVVGSNLSLGFTAERDNLTTYTTGGVTGLTINQRPTSPKGTRGYENRQDVTFRFDQPVYNLSFTIADISSNATSNTSYQFWDAVSVATDSSYTVTSRGSRVSGIGTVTDPLRATQVYTNGADNATSWNASLSFPGRTTYVTLSYWCNVPDPSRSVEGAGGQGITVSNLSMQLAPKGC